MNFVKLVLFIFFAVTHAATPMQYCRVEEELNVDFCVSLASFRNASTGRNDIYIRSSTKFTDRMGWSAVGTGDRMDDSMMFVFYPGAGASDATVSLRTTRGHYPPGEVEDEIDYRVLKVSVHNHYYDISLVCYGCEHWSGNAFDTMSKKQAMIFATRPDQRMQTNDKDHDLHIHADYRIFYLDMTLIHSEYGPAVTPELVNNGRKSAGLHEEKSLKWVPVHGWLMVIAFTFISPLGVIGIRMGARASFAIHWIIQILAGLVAFSSAVLALSRSWKGLELSMKSDVTRHVFLGLDVMMLLFAQPVLGYYHHINYLKKNSRTMVSHFHIWVGRILLMVAWLNTALGLRLTKVNPIYFTAWLSSLGTIVLAMIWVPELYKHIKRYRTRRNQGEASYKLLDSSETWSSIGQP